MFYLFYLLILFYFKKQLRKTQMAYLNDKKKAFTFDDCYQILKEHQHYSLTTTISNTQHSRCGPSDDNSSSSISIGDDDAPITIEGSDLNKPMGRNEAKLVKKRKEKAKSLAFQQAELERSEAFNKLYEEKLASTTKANENMTLHIEQLEIFRDEERQRNIRE